MRVGMPFFAVLHGMWCVAGAAVVAPQSGVCAVLAGEALAQIADLASVPGPRQGMCAIGHTSNPS
jgi:hypothetical protein